jgi:multidrug transporter EmrE-like cation transporter
MHSGEDNEPTNRHNWRSTIMLNKKSLSLKTLATVALLSFTAVSVQPRQSKAILLTPAADWAWIGGATAAGFGAAALTGWAAVAFSEQGNHDAWGPLLLILVGLVILDQHNPGTPQLTTLTSDAVKAYHVNDQQAAEYNDALPEINAKLASIIHAQPANSHNLDSMAATADKSWAEFTPTLSTGAATVLNQIRGVAQAQ